MESESRRRESREARRNLLPAERGPREGALGSRGPPGGFAEVFIPKGVKVVCFDADLHVLILKGVAEGGGGPQAGRWRANFTGNDSTDTVTCQVTVLGLECPGSPFCETVVCGKDMAEGVGREARNFSWGGM